MFKGKVDAVDAAGKWLTVSNENVEGWMARHDDDVQGGQRCRVHRRSKPEIRSPLRVYDGIEDMLYDVQVIPDQKR